MTLKKFIILGSILLSSITFSFERIVSTTPSNTEILVDLGLGDKIIATDMNSKRIEGVSESAKILGLKNTNIELILSLHPDIVIASNHNFNDSENPFELLEMAGIKVIYIFAPEKVAEVPNSIRKLGKAVDKEQEAEILADQFLEEFERIKDEAPVLKRKVYFEINPEPHLFSFGSGTFLNEILEAAGAENIFKNEKGWLAPSREKIFESDPEIILTNFPVKDAEKEILSRELWQELKAVKNKKVYHIDESSLRPSHRIIRSLKEISFIIKTY